MYLAKPVLSPTKTNYLAAFFFAYTVNKAKILKGRKTL